MFAVQFRLVCWTPDVFQVKTFQINQPHSHDLQLLFIKLELIFPFISFRVNLFLTQTLKVEKDYNYPTWWMWITQQTNVPGRGKFREISCSLKKFFFIPKHVVVLYGYLYA